MFLLAEATGTTLWAELSTVFTAILGWAGSTLQAITTGSLSGLLPFLAIPIAFTVIGFAVGLIKRVIG